MSVNILYSFVGNHDPLALPGSGADPGPVISLLRLRRFDHLVLFVTAPEYSERAIVIQQAATLAAQEGNQSPAPRCSFVEIRLESVVDYEEIFARLIETIPEAEANLPYPEDQIRRFVLLDPGTPAMQTVWFLMVRSGWFGATLLQGIPARFAGGSYRVRTVDPSPAAFPQPAKRQSLPAPSPTEPAPPTGSTASSRAKGRSSHQDWTVQASPILGKSAAVSLLLQQIETVARYDEIVLVQGETGTGKELVARHVHNLSPRRRNAYIVVNCAALGSGTVESELFGHVKGAFTGAQSSRNGVFRSAHGGTIFLDEIGELPLITQAKLLRVIEYGELTPVGADRPERVDTRIVAATNRDLHQMVQTGEFRGDLLERLRQLDIVVPPVRKREGDVSILASAFVETWSSTHGQRRTLSEDALAQLRQHTWPSNVRELQNVITRACAFSATDVISGEDIRTHIKPNGRTVTEPIDPKSGIEDVPTDTPAPEPQASEAQADAEAPFLGGPVNLPAILLSVEREWYETALRHTQGRRAEAARLLGLKPPAFRKALKDRFPEL